MADTIDTLSEPGAGTLTDKILRRDAHGRRNVAGILSSPRGISIRKFHRHRDRNCVTDDDGVTPAGSNADAGAAASGKIAFVLARALRRKAGVTDD